MFSNSKIEVAPHAACHIQWSLFLTLTSPLFSRRLNEKDLVLGLKSSYRSKIMQPPSVEFQYWELPLLLFIVSFIFTRYPGFLLNLDGFLWNRLLVEMQKNANNFSAHQKLEATSAFQETSQERETKLNMARTTAMGGDEMGAVWGGHWDHLEIQH